MGVCVFCDKWVRRLSNEHVLSNVVLETFYGKPLKNRIRSARLERELHNSALLIGDFCKQCNEDTSHLDVAGGESAKWLQSQRSLDGQRLPITNDLIAWHVKTHWNLLRFGGQEVVLSRELKDSMRSGKSLPMNQFLLFFEGVDITPQQLLDIDQGRLPDFDSAEFSDKEFDLAYSVFRMRLIHSHLIIPRRSNFELVRARADGFLRKNKMNEWIERGCMHRINESLWITQGYIQFRSLGVMPTALWDGPLSRA